MNETEQLREALAQAMLAIRQAEPSPVSEDSMLWIYWLKLIGDKTNTKPNG